MEKSGEKMMKRETEVGESSSTSSSSSSSSSSSNIWGSSWEFVEQGVTTPLLNLFSYFFTSKTATTQPTTTTLSPPQTKSTEDQLLTSARSIAPQTLRLNGRPPRPPVNSGGGGQTN